MQSSEFSNSSLLGKIIYVQTAFLGDLLLSIPTLKYLKRKYPENKLVLVCRKGLGNLLKELNVIDEYFEIQKGHRHSYQSIIKQLNSTPIKFVFAPHGSLRTALFCRQLKSLEKISFKTWWNFIFFHHRVEKNKLLPDAIRQMQLLTVLDQELQNQIQEMLLHDPLYVTHYQIPEWASMTLDLLPLKFEELQKKINISSESKKIICIFPGSVWPTKRWTEEGFIKLSKNLIDKNFSVFLHGSPEELELCQKIAKHVSEVKIICGQLSLLETIVFLKQCEVVVTNDSGSMHMASVAGASTIAIFGPTVLNLGYRPWQNKVKVIENKNLSCRPCGLHGHKKCPLGTHECMKSITSDLVLENILKLR